MQTRYIAIALAAVAVLLISTALLYPSFQPTTNTGPGTTSTIPTTSSSNPAGGGTTTTSSNGPTTTTSSAGGETTTSSGGGTTTTTTSTELVTSTSVSNSSNGLQLSLHLQSLGNGSIKASVDEFNLRSSTNNVTQANDWKYPPDQLNPSDNCAPSEPAGLAIFQGNYGMNNYTTGKALSLFNTSTEYTCTVNTLPVNFLFQPSSDNASVYIGHQFRYNETSSVSFSGSGYWSGGANSPTSAAFNSFGPGEYTVLGADEWGNVLILHFTVSNA